MAPHDVLGTSLSALTRWELLSPGPGMQDMPTNAIANAIPTAHIPAAAQGGTPRAQH